MEGCPNCLYLYMNETNTRLRENEDIRRIVTVIKNDDDDNYEEYISVSRYNDAIAKIGDFVENVLNSNQKIILDELLKEILIPKKK